MMMLSSQFGSTNASCTLHEREPSKVGVFCCTSRLVDFQAFQGLSPTENHHQGFQGLSSTENHQGFQGLGFQGLSSTENHQGFQSFPST